MARKIFLVLILASVTLNVIAGESKYPDRPMKVGGELSKVFEAYIQQSKKTLPYFINQFLSPKGRTFYVVTRIYQGDVHEQVFVKIQTIKGPKFQGVIASKPLGRVDYQFGDLIEVTKQEVVDWAIVNPDGTEEGNLVGKALELVQAGKAVFVCKIVAENGKYSQFEVASVLNPFSKQEIIEIVPSLVLNEVTAEVKKLYGDRIAKENGEFYTYLFAAFPGWKIEKVSE